MVISGNTSIGSASANDGRSRVARRGVQRRWLNTPGWCWWILLVAGVLTCANAGCGKKKKPRPEAAPPPVVFCLELEAHERLNWFRGQAHTVYARVFPLNGLEAFNATDTKALLADPPPFLPGVSGAPQTRSIYPATKTTFHFSSKESIASFGIVAGYYRPLTASKIVVPAEPGESCVHVDMGESGFPDSPTGAN